MSDTLETILISVSMFYIVFTVPQYYLYKLAQFGGKGLCRDAKQKFYPQYTYLFWPILLVIIGVDLIRHKYKHRKKV